MRIEGCNEREEPIDCFLFFLQQVGVSQEKAQAPEGKGNTNVEVVGVKFSLSKKCLSSTKRTTYERQS